MLIKKQIKSILKLKINAGSATASPPVGPAISQGGLNIAEFCKNFNERTSHIHSDFILPVLIVIFKDSSYEYYVKLPTVTFFLQKASLSKKEKKYKKGRWKAQVDPREFYVGILSPAQLFEIAACKSLQSIYNFSLKNTCYMIAGSAHSSQIYIPQHKNEI